jgi:hypothetical protein
LKEYRQPEVAIKDFIGVLSNPNDATKMTGLLLVPDYLSSTCPRKLSSLTENEQFLEKFPSSL